MNTVSRVGTFFVPQRFSHPEGVPTQRLDRIWNGSN